MKRVFVLATLILLTISALTVGMPLSAHAQTDGGFFLCSPATGSCTPAPGGQLTPFPASNCTATFTNVATIPTASSAPGCYFVMGYPFAVFVVSNGTVNVYPWFGPNVCGSAVYLTWFPLASNMASCFGLPAYFYPRVAFAFNATSSGVGTESTCPVNMSCTNITGSGTANLLGAFTEMGTIVHTTTAGSDTGCTMSYGTIQMSFALGVVSMDLNGETCPTATGTTQTFDFIINHGSGLFVDVSGSGRLSVISPSSSGTTTGTTGTGGTTTGTTYSPHTATPGTTYASIYTGFIRIL